MVIGSQAFADESARGPRGGPHSQFPVESAFERLATSKHEGSKVQETEFNGNPLKELRGFPGMELLTLVGFFWVATWQDPQVGFLGHEFSYQQLVLAVLRIDK